MNKTFVICLSLQFLSLFVSGQSGVSNLLVENLKNPVGLDVRQPRLSASKDIQVKGMEEGYVVVELGSGKYFFTTAR